MSEVLENTSRLLRYDVAIVRISPDFVDSGDIYVQNNGNLKICAQT